MWRNLVILALIIYCALEVKPKYLHAVVLSHGHSDHTLGLIGLLKRFGRHGMPIILHPDAFLKRKNVLPDGHEMDLPSPDRRDIEAEGINVVEERGPTLLIESRILITGRFPEIHLSKRAFRPDVLRSTDNGNQILGYTMIKRL
jgi:7,8-dihydropterin-6-yl-methyl-4-(beta-D-ribofuranosyl)aminobenzene 5'-phosphate synthase